jgi:uncharacterized Zn finger protein
MGDSVKGEAAGIDFEAREARLLRAAAEVLGKYSITSLAPGPDGSLRFRIAGGTRPYEVAVQPEWRATPSCTCPDAAHLGKEQNRGYCKHLIAVLLSNEKLRCQLLDLFL